MKPLCRLLLGLALTGPFNYACAQAPDAPVPEPTSNPAEVQAIVIDGIRSPATLPLRKVQAGTKAFEANRSMAPDSKLRFVFRASQSSAEPLRIRIDDDGKVTPVLIGEDGSFPVHADVDFGKNAALVANRPKSAGEFGPLVRSPGITGNPLRLGDLLIRHLLT